MRDSNFSAIIVKIIATSSIIVSIISASIKIKILRLNKIYLYKNNNKDKYLR